MTARKKGRRPAWTRKRLLAQLHAERARLDAGRFRREDYPLLYGLSMAAKRAKNRAVVFEHVRFYREFSLSAIYVRCPCCDQLIVGALDL